MGTVCEDSRIGNGSFQRKSIKILILGDYEIGKTTLIKSFPAIRDATIGVRILFNTYRLEINLEAGGLDVELFDLYPGANSPKRREHYPTNVNVILLCFSIGHYKTLKSIYNLWIHEVRAHFGNFVPVLLVGLKSDFRLIRPGTIAFTLLPTGKDGIVEKDEAEIIHKKYSFQGEYMECSKYDVKSVIKVFQQAFLVALEG